MSVVANDESDVFGVPDGARWIGVRTTRERTFWIGLACAAVVHASLFAGVSGSTPHQMGEENGAADAINVSLVTEADLASDSTVPVPLDTAPGPVAPEPPAQPAVVEPPPPPPPTPEPEPEAQVEAPPAPPPQAAPAPAERPAETPPTATDLPALQKELPDLLTLPDPSASKPERKTDTPEPPQKATKAAKAKPPPKKPAPQRNAKLDLSTPDDYDAPSGAGGRSAAASRPPGITRSGWNDEFGRNVIRALQQTMPQLRDASGRVTVKILLTDTGNVQDVRLINGAQDPALNQDVVFAAKQTNYPIPPTGSTLEDRTFLITYVYRQRPY